MSSYSERYWEEKEAFDRHLAKPPKIEKEETHCICDTVNKINKAQHEVTDDSCDTSCEEVKKLLSTSHKEKKKPVHTTIPFLLYTVTGEPFIGSGVTKISYKGSKRKHFECIETPVFKVKNVDKYDKCCVNLELLLPVSKDHKVARCNEQSGNVCKYFPIDDKVTDFIATGICMTVDLNNFTAITCLDPITPLPA